MLTKIILAEADLDTIDYREFTGSEDQLMEILNDELLIELSIDPATDTYTLEAGMWYSDNGTFKMTVNNVDMNTAIEMFILATNRAAKAEMGLA